MKNSLASIFSYLFMVSAFVSMASAFCLVVVLLRYLGNATSETEMNIARYFLVVLVSGIVLTPLLLFTSDKLGKLGKRREEV